MKVATIKTMLSVIACTCLCGASANANMMTFDTAAGDAQAVFTTSAGQLTITLKNLGVDPESVADCLSALGFGLTDGVSMSLASSSGLERTVAADGTHSDGSTVATGWILSGSPASALLDVLTGGGAGPAHTIIGAPDGTDVYGSANSSVAGNGPHNPFLVGDVSFTLDVPGLTAASGVNNVFFQFGTLDGQNRTKVPDGGATILMLGAALSGLGLFGRRIKK